jgi:hypothetical protein
VNVKLFPINNILRDGRIVKILEGVGWMSGVALSADFSRKIGPLSNNSLLDKNLGDVQAAKIIEMMERQKIQRIFIISDHDCEMLGAWTEVYPKYCTRF